MCTAPAQVKARLWGGVGGVMGTIEEKTVYPETLIGPDLAVVGTAAG